MWKTNLSLYTLHLDKEVCGLPRAQLLMDPVGEGSAEQSHVVGGTCTHQAGGASKPFSLSYNVQMDSVSPWAYRGQRDGGTGWNVATEVSTGAAPRWAPMTPGPLRPRATAPRSTVSLSLLLHTDCKANQKAGGRLPTSVEKTEAGIPEGSALATTAGKDGPAPPRVPPTAPHPTGRHPPLPWAQGTSLVKTKPTDAKEAITAPGLSGDQGKATRGRKEGSRTETEEGIVVEYASERKRRETHEQWERESPE